MIKRRHDKALHRSKTTKNKKQLQKMSFSSPFLIEDLHRLKPLRGHVIKIQDQKASQMSKHADTIPLAKFHNGWINHSLETKICILNSFVRP